MCRQHSRTRGQSCLIVAFRCRIFRHLGVSQFSFRFPSFFLCFELRCRFVSTRYCRLGASVLPLFSFFAFFYVGARGAGGANERKRRTGAGGWGTSRAFIAGELAARRRCVCILENRNFLRTPNNKIKNCSESMSRRRCDVTYYFCPE